MVRIHNEPSQLSTWSIGGMCALAKPPRFSPRRRPRSRSPPCATSSGQFHGLPSTCQAMRWSTHVGVAASNARSPTVASRAPAGATTRTRSCCGQ
jgi:hypothetical protein